jgi:hypothetical protein
LFNKEIAMRIDRFQTFLLLAIAVSLAAIALRPYVAPPAAQAQSSELHSLFIEPGTALLRAPDGSQQVIGKVVIDLSNGNVWGFPTQGGDPYPSSGIQTSPQVSHPFLLGKYALSDMNK